MATHKTTSTPKLHPQAERRIREVVRARDVREVEAAKWDSPHCLDCGNTRISYLYMDRINGGVIDEAGAFSMVATIIGDAIDGETEDPSWLSELAHAQYELACMWKSRPGQSEERTAQ